MDVKKIPRERITRKVHKFDQFSEVKFSIYSVLHSDYFFLDIWLP